jgi:hypothetical protein
MKGLALLLLFLLSLQLSMAQQHPLQETDLEQLIEDLFPLQSEDLNYEDMYEVLYQYYRMPLNLNTASRQELQSLFILSELQINNLLEHRNKFGDLLSIYELQSIQNFDLATIHKLLPFVKVQHSDAALSPRSLWQKIRQEENHYLLLRYERTLETKQGYLPLENQGSARYAGSPDKFYARYRIAHTNDFSLGFTVEKDAGEQVIWDSKSRRYGADFISGHIALQNRGRLKNVILGDYQLQFGQGLLLSGGLSIGKGSETITTLRRNNLGARPYTSVLETGFMRGAAATYELSRRIQLTTFYSRLRIDGSLQSLPAESLDQQEEYFSSIGISGFHRTPTEVTNKGAIISQTGGTNIAYSSPHQNLQIGFSALATLFDKPFIRNSSSYNQFVFRGNQLVNAGLYYSYIWQNFNFFGEAAHTTGGGSAVVNGLIFSLSSNMEMSMLYRNYARGFSSFYGNAFGENTQNSNERGMYWGLKLRPFRKWTVSAYYDKFAFPWLAYQADAPSHGHEWLGRIAFTPNKATSIYAQVRMEVKEKNLANNAGKLNELANNYRRNYLINLDYKAQPNLTLKTRVQFSSFEQKAPATLGYIILQDINLNIRKVKLSSRFAIFDTDDYNNRQYVYERNVLYAFSLPAYYGRGIRAYLLAQYNISKKIDCWIRIARTDYRDRKRIGSGLEEIEGNTKTDLTVQLRYKF